MGQAKGFMGRLVVDFETTFGSSPTTKAGKSLPFNTIGLGGSQALVEPATIQANRNPVRPGLGRITVDGSIAIPLDLNAIGYWLKGLFGAPTTTGTTTYTHVFKPTNAQPSMVIEKGFTDIGQYFLYNGCKVNNFKLPFGGDGELVATLDILGATEALSTTAYVASPTVVALERLNNFQAAIKEGGSAISTVLSGEFTIAANLDGSQYTVGTSYSRGDIPEGIMSISGSIKTIFSDASLLNKAINSTESSLELKYTSETKSLTFLFPEVQYERPNVAIDGPAGIAVDLNWRAYYDNATEAAAAVVTLINSTSTY